MIHKEQKDVENFNLYKSAEHLFVNKIRLKMILTNAVVGSHSDSPNACSSMRYLCFKPEKMFHQNSTYIFGEQTLSHVLKIFLFLRKCNARVLRLCVS